MKQVERNGLTAIDGSCVSWASKRRAAPPKHLTSDGFRIYAIGDVHGCLREMIRILGEIERDIALRNVRSHIVFLGDLVDRGPDSAGVVDHLLETHLRADCISFLKGNHEEAMIACYDGDTRSFGPWLQNGGVRTLTSYGLSEAEIFTRPFSVAEAMHKAIPAAHIEFMRGFKDHIQIGDYLFVHAGIRPGVPLERQASRDLRWIRTDFLESDADHGFVVVHGHTIVDQVRKKPNRIAVDTGCYATGKLSVVAIEDEEVLVLSTPTRANSP